MVGQAGPQRLYHSVESSLSRMPGRQAGDEAGEGSALDLGVMGPDRGDLLVQPRADVEACCDVLVRNGVRA